MVLLEHEHGVNCLSKVVILMWDKLFQKRLKRIEKRGERQKAKQEIIDKYAGYYPQKQGAKVSNIMLVIIVINITIYTIASFWLTYVSGLSVDSTLTTGFFAFWGTEIALLAGIKCSKVFEASRSNKIVNKTVCEDEESVG